MLRIQMLRCVGDQGCAGASWGRISCFIWAAVKAGFGTGTGVIGLLPILSFTVYGMGDRGSGILYAFRGLGALAGPFLARPFIRDRDLRSLR